MASEIVTQDDVKRNLNLLERILDSASSDDEYLAAVIQNQMLMTQALSNIGVGDSVVVNESHTTNTGTIPSGGATNDSRSGVDTNNLPIGYIGLALEEITSSSEGKAKFTLGGTEMEVTVEANNDINKDQAVTIVGSGNLVSPSVRAKSIESSEPDENNTATYYTSGEDAIEVTETDLSDGRINLGLVASSISVRHTDSVVVSFVEPTEDEDTGIYLSEEGSFSIGGEPPINTSYIWVKQASDAASTPEIRVEAYK